MMKYLHLSDFNTLTLLYQLQKQSYAQEAQLIHFYDIPPLKESIEDLRRSDETFVGYMQQQEILGAISYKVNKGMLDIHRLMVHPNHMRKGIAQALISFILQQKKVVLVATPQKNTPAVNLYVKMGFVKTYSEIVAADLQMQHFRFEPREI